MWSYRKLPPPSNSLISAAQSTQNRLWPSINTKHPIIALFGAERRKIFFCMYNLEMSLGAGMLYN